MKKHLPNIFLAIGVVLIIGQQLIDKVYKYPIGEYWWAIIIGGVVLIVVSKIMKMPKG